MSEYLERVERSTNQERKGFEKGGSTVPRKGFIAQREVLPDPIYNNIVVTKLINKVMFDGKKGVAQNIVYDAFNMVAEKTSREALEVFQEALNKLLFLSIAL